MRPGYTALLEWGHSGYLDNKTDNETPADETIDIANDINKKNLSENSAEETVVKKSAKSQTELD